MKLRTLLLGLLVIAGVGMMEARTVKYTISLVQPEYVSEKGEAGWVDNTVATLPGNKEFFIDQWDPVTGEIRVDCGYGCWSSNFSISNKTPFRGAITKVELVYTGELDPEFVTFETKTGDFPVFYGDYEAKVEPGKLVWDLDWHGKKDMFHIQIESTRDLKMSRVFVSEINVYYNNRVRCNTDGPAVEEDEEVEGPQPIEPEEPPTDTLVIGDPKPIREPEVNEKDKKELWKWIGQLDPTQPDTRIGDNWDLTGPVPPGTEDIKKHLLDQLTEEELGAIRAKYGEDMEYACRNWSKDIPKIKREQSAECLEILGRTPYSELMKFIQGFIENIMMGLADGADLWNSALGDNSHSNYEGLSDHMPLLGEDYEEFRKNPTDAGWQEFSKKADEKVPFADVVIKYDLWDYIYLNIEVEGLD